MQNLRIASMNIRGLGNNFKCKKIFNYLHQKEIDIALLQETHSIKSQAKIWCSQWHGCGYFSHGESNARGVAIFINKKANIQVKHIYKDDKGRDLILDVVYENLEFSLCNLYAPNEDSPEFFMEVIRLMNKAGNITEVIAGDFNLVLDMELDKMGGNQTTHFKSQKILKEFCNIENLNDIWRSMHETEKNFTWYRSKPFPIAERLDYFLVSHSLALIIIRSDIYPSFCTDHCMISIVIQLHKVQRGPGFWKFNNALLDETDYTDNARETIKEVLVQTFENTRKKWDFLKYKAKEMSIRYSVRKKRREMNKMQLYERKLKRLLKEQNENIRIFTEQNTQSEIQKIQDEIDQIMEKKTKGAMIHSRVDWYLYGEKPSSYFFQLERYNHTRKNRFSLYNAQSEIVTDINEILQIQHEFYEKLFTGAIRPDNKFLENLEHKKLTPEMREELDAPIQTDEIALAMSQMAENKVMGPDGISIEWIRAFWDLLEKFFIDLIIEISQHGLTPDEGCGVISLIDKPGKNMMLLDNW